MFHCWLDEVIVCWLDMLAVLQQHIHNCPTSLFDVALNAASKANVVRCEHKNFQIHDLSKPLFENCMNALKHNDWRCLDQLNLLSP